MKQMFSVITLAAALLSLTPPVQAQDPADAVRHAGSRATQAPRTCSTLGLWAMRGTYAFTATAWQDLSAINPALPKGYAPVTIIGAFKLGGNGDVTGWASVNAGGVPMTAEFVESQFGAPKADCSVPISLSMKIKEYGGVVTGPYTYVGVFAGDEILFMMLGTGPGSHVELNHAKRISMNFN
jgi:hypothetical protein